MPGTIDSSAEPTKLTRSTPAWPASIAPGGGDGDLELGEHRAGVAQEGRAGRRQLDSPARAGEQRAAQLLLQRADLLAERRLGDVQARGGAAEVQLLGDGDEVTQLAEFHERSFDGGDSRISDT